MSDVLREVAELLYGDGATELIAKMNPTPSDLGTPARKKKGDFRQRAITAGLSAVGGAAGATGMAVAAKDIHRLGWKKTPRLTRTLLPLEVAGLGGEIMSTKILGGDVKNKPKKPKGTLIKKDLGELVSQSKVPTKASLTRAAVTNPKVRRKGVEYSRKTGGMLRKLPAKVEAHNKVEKSAEVEITWSGEIAKANEDKQQVFGWASVVEVNGEPVIDLQGDYISPDEMEKAAYTYVMKSRKGGDMHLRNNWEPIQKSEMIESFIVTKEKREAMGLPDSVPTGWWVGFQVQDPELWSDVKAGKRTGFSIHGRGRREPM